MTGSEALSRLVAAGKPFFTTRDAEAALDIPKDSVTRLLQGLAAQRLIGAIRHGHWSLNPAPRPLAYAAWAADPYPSYVSLYTALYNHGMIQQIPQVVYAVSLAKTQVIETAWGTLSLHQISPELFGGWVEQDGIRQATPEKALFDALYLSRASSGRFAALTEVDLPDGFRPEELQAWAYRITDAATRTRTLGAIERFRPQAR